jgi:GNAT superfamily N-acetyltransferase
MSGVTDSSTIERWTSAHPRWSELMALQGVEDLDLEAKTQEWHLSTRTLVALEDDEIAGVLRFWTQVIGVDEDKPSFLVDGEPSIEAKVVTFHVLDRFRSGGIGRRLQLAAVRWARELGCYQLRSRSPYASEANHGLKASLGFGISPGRNRPDGDRDTAFFVLPLRMDQELVTAIEG